MKVYLTVEQAISVLPEGDSIHTFYNPGFGLLGADWQRSDIIHKLSATDSLIELTGKMARGMEHGICVYSKNAKLQSEILFVETDETKLSNLEKKLERD